MRAPANSSTIRATRLPNHRLQPTPSASAALRNPGAAEPQREAHLTTKTRRRNSRFHPRSRNIISGLRFSQVISVRFVFLKNYANNSIAVAA